MLRKIRRRNWLKKRIKLMKEHKYNWGYEGNLIYYYTGAIFTEDPKIRPEWLELLK